MPNWKTFKGLTLSTYVFTSGQAPRHTLPNLDQIYAISEVLILNNDQTNIKKNQQTTGLTKIIRNSIQLLLIGVIVVENFYLKKCVCLLFTIINNKTVHDILVDKYDMQTSTTTQF